MKVFGQLEKAQLENTTADVGALPKGMITYRTDLNIAKVSNGTSMLALIDESSTQTLSGKTYATPTFTGAFTMAQATTPANPSSGNNKFYFKADGKLYTLDASGNEAAVGSGAGGGVTNLITNGNADDTAASIFVPYADTGSRPVDGTGGSPTVTTSVTSTTPLNGVKSYLLTKPASNVQGQGWAVPFTVDLAYRAKSLKISADYIINSGTFAAGSNGLSPTDGDLIWYIYDVTNSQLIEPSNIKMFSQDTGISDKFEATFQTSVSGSSYRLLAHVASTSALAFEIKLDNITVSPQVYVYGTPVTDWQPYTPIFTGLGTVTSEGVFWRRVGDSLEIKGTAISGTVAASVLSISMPPGMNVAPSKNPSTTNTASHGVAYNCSAGSGNPSSGAGPYVVFSDSNADANLLYISKTNAGARFAKDNGGAVFGSSERFRFEVKGIPIAGWSSSVQMSDAADTRVVDFKAFKSGGDQNGASGVVSFTSVDDTHGGFDLASGSYTVKVAGDYIFGYSAEWAAPQGVPFTIRINGSVVETYGGSSATSLYNTYQVLYKNLKAGDVIIVSSATGSVLALSNFYFYGSRISGPSAIAASEETSLHYGANSGQVLGAGDTTLQFNAKYSDTHSLFASNTTATVKQSGRYWISTQAHIAPASNTSATCSIDIRKNGVAIKQKTLAQSFLAGEPYDFATWVLADLVAGDQLSSAFSNGFGVNGTVSSTLIHNSFIVVKVK